MSATSWIISAGVLLLSIAVAAGLMLVRRRLDRMRALVRIGARRLRGRIDPASEASPAPALLAELDGRLLRAAGWPVNGEGAADAIPPYLEVCTPVEGVTAPLVVVRRSEAARLVPLLADATRGLPVADLPTSGLAVYGLHQAAWAARVLARHPSWVLLELDSRMLRILTKDPQGDHFDAVAVEHAVRGFAAAVPAILLAAGLTNSSARGGQP